MGDVFALSQGHLRESSQETQAELLLFCDQALSRLDRNEISETSSQDEDQCHNRNQNFVTKIQGFFDGAKSP